jgi:hypothetical protein
LEGGDSVTRKQRIRTCNNLAELLTISDKKSATRIYRQQLIATASRLKQKEQPQRTTA